MELRHALKVLVEKSKGLTMDAGEKQAGIAEMLEK
jgi:hypothetical protein